MLKKVICILVIFLVAFGVCACSLSYPFMIGLEYEKSAYNIDDVTLKFFYGVRKDFIKDGLEDESAYVYGDAHIFFSLFHNFVNNDRLPDGSFNYYSPEIFLIKTIPRTEFFSDKYLQTNNRGKPISFKHSEMITVPQELFAEKRGTIYFYLRIDRKVNGSKSDSVDFIFFDYRLEGEKVFITNVNLNR